MGHRLCYSNPVLFKGRCVRLFAVILLVAAVAPGMTVLCLAPAGHAALENNASTCCLGFFSRFWGGEEHPLSSQTFADCSGCVDIPLVGTILRSDTVSLLDASEHAAHTPVALETPERPFILVGRNLSHNSSSAAPTDPIPLVPLRC